MSQYAINISAGVVGSFIGFAFGGWSPVLELFLFCLALDYISGVAAAAKEKSLNSETGFLGIVKKVLQILAVMLAFRVDEAFSLNGLTMNGILFAFIANELISIAENYGRLNLPLSQYIKPILEVLQKNNKAR